MNEGRVEQMGSSDEVYEHPANPFVLNFLGGVNLFHGRVHNGHATLGGIRLETPEHADADNTPAVGYVRSHDIVIERVAADNSSIAAEVVHVHAVGPSVRLELSLREGNETMEAELTREAFRELSLNKGEPVFVRPRKVRVFVEDYQV